MAREAVEPVAHVVDELGGQPGGKLYLIPNGLGITGVEILGEAVDLGLGEPESFANILKHRASPVGDDIGHHRGPLPAVALVAVLDDLFASLRFEVDVDIGWSASFRR